MHFNHCHVMALKSSLLNNHLRQWENVAPVSNSSQFEEQPIVHRRTCVCPVISNPNEHNTRQAMIGKIICKCTNCLTNSIRVRKRLLPLNTIGFEVVEELLKLTITQHFRDLLNYCPSCTNSSACSFFAASGST